jgi:hypothetical protein
MRDGLDPGIVLVFLFALLVFWAPWYITLALVTRLASSQRDRRVLYLTPLVCFLILPLAFLGKELADPQRGRGRLRDTLFVGALLLSVTVWMIPWLGLSARDDVAEGRNRPAGWAIGGAILALTLAYGSAAGATRGTQMERQAPLVGSLSIFAVLILWGLLEKLAHVAEAITVERDAGAAARLAAFLPALGLLVGRGLPTFLTRPDAMPSLAALGGPIILLLAGIVIERRPRSVAKPGGRPTAGDALIALSYLVGAGLWSALLL